MKRFFSKGSSHRSRDDVEREAAAELAAATGLGTVDPPFSQPSAQEEAPAQQ